MYQLGTIILPNPKKFTRNIIEDAVENLRASGRTTKKYQNRKEQYVLEYQYLTQAQVGQIMSLYEQMTSLSFVVTETNLPIAATDVLMDVSNRSLPDSGELYLENMTITLTEVI